MTKILQFPSERLQMDKDSGKISYPRSPSEKEDLSERMQRIRNSLEKINFLMKELRKDGKSNKKSPSNT